jgi:hypothetical protein
VTARKIREILLTRNIYGSVTGDGNSYDGDTIQDLIRWLKDLLKEIPKEYRRTARICIDSVTEHDCSYAELNVFYERPETANERRTRTAAERRYEQLDRERRREQYEALKRDFEKAGA